MGEDQESGLDLKSLIMFKVLEFQSSDYLLTCFSGSFQSKDSEAEFTEENLIHCLLDLFGAGTESTAKSLSWSLLYMAKYPEVQGEVMDVQKPVCS